MACGQRRRSTILSGNGNAPTTQLKLSLFHFELHIHDVMSIARLLVGGIALYWWLKSMKQRT